MNVIDHGGVSESPTRRAIPFFPAVRGCQDIWHPCRNISAHSGSPHFCSLSLPPHLAPSIYSALGFSYLVQKKRPELRASHELNLLISSLSLLTDCTSMLVCAISSGRDTSKGWSVRALDG